MPKISEQHREERRRHVLVCAWRCFARDGFHVTSMDDVIAETGMSASGVYRYISGKDELIEAAGVESAAMFRSVFDRLLAAPEPPRPAELLRALTAELGRRPNSDLSRIAVQAWAEALRNPAVAANARAFHAELRGRLGGLARRWQALGQLPPAADPDVVGLALATLLPGLLVAQHVLGGIAVDSLVAGLRGWAGPG
ncbi:TetR/AcrR family transcriptional regulator [Amycolatopsis sp. PS_44_ISF1]|uniref:TetR/AcrR family transcriptional regulator n=1 Tax=Amycolatopsis sp. PS_44_ISF1 TaxID=2974917 RepID=UPI0028E095A9|nr:TetR/AcrR family transcriptional regulator [Amycolatopsis sp. PS_44_ISF1]MDT8913447.1 TetR/AcrR family transcriptional regulator [Amycolatopsis sp. PS_44_ISF1]